MSENGRGAEWANSEAPEAAIGELRETEEECPGVWYASTYRGSEQSGGDSPLGRLLTDANYATSPDWMIRLTSEAGTNFLRFRHGNL